MKGEVYRIPDTLWPALDAWEEVPNTYQRPSSLLVGWTQGVGLRSTLSQYREGGLETAEQHLHRDRGEEIAAKGLKRTPPLFKTRLHMRRDAAEKLWKELHPSGWQQVDPCWGP